MRAILVDVLNIIVKNDDYWVVLQESGSSGRVLPIAVRLEDIFALSAILSGHGEKQTVGFGLSHYFLKAFRLNISKMLIHGLTDHEYHCSLYIDSAEKTINYSVDFAEGLAYCLKYNVPIFLSAPLLKELQERGEMLSLMEMVHIFGIDEGNAPLSENEISALDFKADFIQNISLELEKLTKKLEDAVIGENYEEAAKLRDRINRIKLIKIVKE